MKTLAVDVNNDIYMDGLYNLALIASEKIAVTSLPVEIVANQEAIKQVCEHRAKALLSEMVFYQNDGLPYMTTVFNGSPDTRKFQAALILTLTSVTDVLEVKDVSVSVVGGSLAYSATIRTSYGETAIKNG